MVGIGMCITKVNVCCDGQQYNWCLICHVSHLLIANIIIHSYYCKISKRPLKRGFL